MLTLERQSVEASAAGPPPEGIHLLDNRQYADILRQMHTVIFKDYLATERYDYSSYISEYLAGNYDVRRLSSIFLEDGVIHPQDRAAFERFLFEIEKRDCLNHLELRLKSRQGGFRWFRLQASSLSGEDGRVIAGVLTDADGEIQMREALRYRAEYDTATGIFNKTTFFQKTEELLTAHPECAYSLVRFDIDRFKSVNELFSVTEGDRVLCHIGQCIKKCVHIEETYARLGNDVFCLCVCRSDEDILLLLEKLNEAINSYPIDFNFVMSAGIFHIDREDGQPINVLCDRAALAQRSVKGNYVRRSAFYEGRMGEALSKEHYIIGSMRRALDEGEFVIYLQPKFSMHTNTAFGAEALVRWKHPTDGLIPPGEFIPLFERNGFVVKLDEYVWELTCKTLRSWIDRGIRPVPISVNVSRLHLYNTGFCDKILALTHKYQLNPRLLELEITESTFTENQQTICEIIEQMHKKGFLFSMDDFGSGYSSLNVLKDIPVDVLKIDLDFLRESKRGPAVGKTILESTIHMARKLKLPVIAEGVETPKQVSVLKRAGCSKAQGYFYAKPMPVADFERIILKKSARWK